MRHVSGHPVTTVVPAPGEHGALVRMSSPKQSLFVPTAALPYLGNTLDPALFDISKVATGLTVHVTGPKLSAIKIPGLRVTHRSANDIAGTFDASGSAAFGAALRRQATSDRAAHRIGGALFGASRISVSATQSHPVRPAFAQVTTRFTVLDRRGRPADSAMLFALNLDNPMKFEGPVMAMAGQARASLPKGRYSIFALVSDDTADSVITLPLVRAQTNLQKVTIDARRATAKVSLVTPRPTAAPFENTSLDVVQTVDFEDGDTVGEAFVDNGIVSFGRRDLFISPSAAPPVGTQTVSTNFLFGNDQASAAPYSYTASYASTGAIATTQQHVARDLATLNMTYFRSVPGVPDAITHMRLLDGYLPSSSIGWSTPRVGRSTDYVVSPKGTVWQDDYSPSMDPMAGVITDMPDLPRYRLAGHTYTVDFLRGPLAPGLAAAPSSSGFVCYACRSGNQLVVGMSTLTDSVPGHFGMIGFVSTPGGLSQPSDNNMTVAEMKIWQDGKLVDTQTNETASLVQVPQRATTIRALVQTWLSRIGFTRSTHSVTDLTIRTSGKDSVAPASWDCGANPWEPTTCRIPTELTTSVPLPTASDGSMTVGSHPFTFSIAPLIGASPVTATFQISLDGGRTFTSVPVTALAHNQFRAALTNSPGSVGKSVTIRVSGHLADGTSITQTTDAAYVVKGA